jgi:transposase
MQVLYILGADLSKRSIDLVAYPMDVHLQVTNDPEGFRCMVSWMETLGIKKEAVMVVMEHTGLYSHHLEAFLHQGCIAFCKVAALQIQRSLGMVRGKNDRVDAARIARYGWEKKDTLRPCPKTDATLLRLKMLRSARHRLCKHQTALKCALKELRGILPSSDVVMRSHLELIDEFGARIKALDKEIASLIQKSEALKTNYELLVTIKGVGPQIALASLVKTHNFTRFTSSRKFACYAGTAPFEHRSGTSIRKKTRVSHLADKEVKTLLDLGASSAIQHDEELKAYYQRRIQEGKSKKSTINIVRNKIIHRMFAVIKRQTPFVTNYQRA